MVIVSGRYRKTSDQISGGSSTMFKRGSGWAKARIEGMKVPSMETRWLLMLKDKRGVVHHMNCH